MKLTVRLALLAGGAALFAWYLQRVGLTEVAAALRRLGWSAPLVVVPYFVVYLIDTLGWRCSFPAPPGVGFAALWRIRWAGEAVNNVVPSAYVGGEAVKVLLLQQRGVPTDHSTSAAIVSKSAQTLAQLLFVCAAAVAFLQLAPHHPGLRTGLLVVLVGGLTAVLALFWIQRRGVFATVRQLTDRLRWNPRWLLSRQERLRALDATITGFYRDHPRAFFASTSAYLAGWLLDTLEIYLVAHLLQQPLPWTGALVIEAFVGVAKVLGLWVPGALGVQESGLLLLGRALGLPEPFCLAYALIRRAREVVFVAIGWLFLSAEHASLGGLHAATHQNVTSR